MAINRQINVFAPTEPHAKQLEVLNAFDSGKRFVLLRAGRKFRKTSLMISWLFEKAFETGKVCAYIAPSYKQAKLIAWNDHIQRMLSEFKAAGLSYQKNEVELTITLPNGGKVQLLGIENEEALRGISNWGAVAMDEYDDWKDDIFPLVILPNLIVANAPVLVGGTPKGYGNIYNLEHSFSNIWTAFHFTSHDNPDISREALEELEKQYKSYGEGVYRQEILAEYNKPEGTVYAEWDDETHYIPFDYDPSLPLHLSWDFGVNDPTSILFLQRLGSEIRLIDYYEASDANLEHFVSFINSRPYKHPELETGDIAGRGRELTTGKSPIEMLASMGHHIRTSPIPSIVDQVRNAHQFIPRLYVSKSNPNCSRFRDSILSYKYPEKSSTVHNQSNEIPLHNWASHALRAWEYYCWNTVEPQTESDEAYERYMQNIRTVRDRTLGF